MVILLSNVIVMCPVIMVVRAQNRYGTASDFWLKSLDVEHNLFVTKYSTAMPE